MTGEETAPLPAIVTDNGIRAMLDYPGHTILVRAADVAALPEGAVVIVASYRTGSRREDPVEQARALLEIGWLNEAETPERPLG